MNNLYIPYILMLQNNEDCNTSEKSEATLTELAEGLGMKSYIICIPLHPNNVWVVYRKRKCVPIFLEPIKLNENSLIPQLSDTELNVSLSLGNLLPVSRMFRGCHGHPITDMNCCTRGRPCSIGQGDCDFDSDCQNGLKCGTDNCYYQFPTAQGYNWEIMADCCYRKVLI